MAAEINQETVVEATESVADGQESLEVEETTESITDAPENLDEEDSAAIRDSSFEIDEIQSEEMDEEQEENQKEIQYDPNEFWIKDGVLREYGGWDRVVHIPDGVTEIGEFAFENSGVEEIYLPDSVKTITCHAFARCKSIKYIDLGKLENLNAQAFCDCGEIECIKLPETLKNIGYYYKPKDELPEERVGPFWDGTTVHNIILYDGITEIPANLFIDCDLRNFELPDTVTSIGDHAFMRCKGIENLKFPEGLKSIGVEAFYEASLTGTKSLPESLTSIGTYAFWRCSDLIIEKLPDKIENIGRRAFGCKKILNTRIPITLKGNTYEVFNNVEMLNFSIEEGLTELGYEAFEYNTIKEVVIPEGIEKIGECAFEGCDVEKLVLPSTLKTIESRAFRYNNISEVEIPESVTSIGKDAFDGNWIIIYGKKGSYAEKYADEHGNRFIPIERPATDFTVSPGNIELKPNEEIQLNLDITPEYCTDSIKFVSANTNIVKVDVDGLVKAVGVGKTSIRVMVGKIEKIVNVTVTTPDITLRDIKELQSSHDYENMCDQTWVYENPTLDRIYITFSEQTEVEEDFDFIYIYDGNDNELGKYTGKELSNMTVSAPGNVIKIRLTSDEEGTAYGFSVVLSNKEECIEYIQGLAYKYKSFFKTPEEKDKFLEWIVSDADRIVEEFGAELKAYNITWSEALAIFKKILYEED
jgi:hypothetical protein